MNISSRSPSSLSALAACLAFTLAVLAQDPPAPADKPVPPPTPGATTAPTLPVAEPIPAATPTPANPNDPAAGDAGQTPSEDKSGLRQPDAPAKRRPGIRGRNGNGGEFPIGDHFVPKGSEMRDAVSVFGSTTVEGDVHGDAVSVFGSTRVGPAAKVSGAAVSVLGRLEVEGDVRGEAVSVLGGGTVNSKIGGEVVSVLGNMHLGPKAEVGGDIVIVGGKLTKDPSAIVHGNEVNVPLAGGFGNVEWLVAWVKECALKGRLLAVGPHLGWAWGVAFAFFVFYLLLALLFPRGIEKCALTLETRPGASVLASVLTVLLTPIVTILLAVTVVGVLLVPFVGAGLFFAGLFGKAVMFAWIGRRFTKFFGDGPLAHPVFAVAIGGLLVMVLYTFWGSILLYKLLSWLGLGVVVLTVAQTIKREKAPVAVVGETGTPSPVGAMPVENEPSSAPAPVAGAVPVSAVGAVGPTTSAGFTGAEPPSMSATAAAENGIVTGGATEAPPAAAAFSAPSAMGVPSAPPPPPPASAVPLVASFAPPLPPRPQMPRVAVAALPRAGFFPRLAALALDGLIIILLVKFASGFLPPFLRFHDGPTGVFLAMAIYAAVMWKNKGTTIGGIVCGLKVVRLDSREIDWATAIVRALSCFLSLVVAGLGFLWVVFDDEKQSWHDKIAGTTVVRVPKGVSLL